MPWTPHHSLAAPRRRATFLLLVSVAVATARRLLPAEFEVAQDVRIVDSHGRRRLTDSTLKDAEHFHVSFRTASAGLFDLDVSHVNLWAPHAKLIVNQGGVSRELPPPRLPSFRGHLSNASRGAGGTVAATVLGDGTLRLHIYEGGHDIMVESASAFASSSTPSPSLNLGDHIVYRDVDDLKLLGATDAVLHGSATPKPSLHVVHEDRRRLHDERNNNMTMVAGTSPTLRRRLSLPSGPPYGRMNNCPAQPNFYTNTIGIVADYGFSAASVSPATPTSSNVLTAISSIISSTNTIYTDQVGIEFSLGTTIINLDGSGALANTGPNYSPSSSGSRNVCGAEVADGYYQYDKAIPNTEAASSSNTINVEIYHGHDKMIGRLANWVGLSAPACSGCSHWHLLTDCYPAAGTVGLAYTGNGCEPLNSRRGVVTDSGNACDDCDVKIASTGKLASVSYYTSIECPAGEYVCAAPAAFTSWTASSTWRTFAHEVGHIYSATHTFANGGLMAYGNDEQFYDNGEVCSYVNSILADTSGVTFQTNCLVTGNSVCGNSVKSTGGAEECDDGNTNAGDGCSATCTIECGYTCSENGAGLSTCAAKCGDNTVDYTYYEECDSSSSCCTSATCKFAANSVCDGGQCCSSSCALKHSREACTTVTVGPSTVGGNPNTDGYCGVAGDCVSSVCYKYALASCEKPLSSTCTEHCNNNGNCINLFSASGGAHGYLEAGTPCLDSSSAAGLCDGSGSCVTSATCGNGVVEAGEECDDTSICCSSCKLADGAVCSSSVSSECCTAQCAFQTASTSCSSGSGFCVNGRCDTTAYLCTLTLDGSSAVVDTATCPIGAASPGNLQYACAVSCKKTSDNACLSGAQFVSDANKVHYLPEGTACNAQTNNPASPVVNGVCITDSGGTSRSCVAVADTCVLPLVTSAGNGDPHLVFANGGKADFRGTHRGWYAFVSSPGFQFAPMFQEVDFWFDAPTGVRQLVHGTFMTRAAWVVRTSAGRELYIDTDAMRAAEVEVRVFPRRDKGVVEGVAYGEKQHMRPWQRLTFDDVTVSTRMLTTVVETPMWQVNVTSRPIYGLVPPLLNETHVHRHWEEKQRRFDFLVHGAFPQPNAHGIVGQSYRDGTVRNGKLDEYAAETHPELADSDGMLPTLTTSAQAEGAIDGVYTDYKLRQAFSTSFEFSRYEQVTKTQGLGVQLQTTRTATGSDWNGRGKSMRTSYEFELRTL